MPLDTGQSAVIRFLGDVSYYEDLRTIVADPIVCNMMLDYLQRSYGMLLIVGPTGSVGVIEKNDSESRCGNDGGESN